MMAGLLRILLMSCVALGLGVLSLFLLGSRSWTQPAPHPADAGLFEQVLPQRKLATINNGDEIAARPLFSSSRRPVDVEQPLPTAAPLAEPIDGAKVHGLFGRDGAWGVILSLNGKVSRLRPGEQLGPWKLLGIAGEELEFVNETGERASLQLRPLPIVAAPAAAPAAGKAEKAAPAREQSPPAEAPEQASSPESQSE